jgi:hypothetical protein
MRAFILVVLLAAPCVAQELQTEPPIQARIEKVVAALSTRDPLHLNVAAIQELKALNDAVSDKHEIVKQIAVFSMGPSEGHPLAALAVLDMLELPPKVVIRVLAPHLDSENVKLRSFVRDWFQGHDKGGPDDPLKPVNFQDYVDYVRGQEPPDAFKEYIFQRSPSRALLVYYEADYRTRAAANIRAAAAVIRAEGEEEIEAAKREAAVDLAGLPATPKDVLLAEEVISHAVRMNKLGSEEAMPEAKRRLAELADHKEWWVRLYVAEMMRRHRMLRQDEVVAKLAKDENALVKKAAS